MKRNSTARIVLSEARGKSAQQLEVFALLNLGIVQSLATGTLSASQAIQCFYHADNCLHVRNRLRNRDADQIMSHGVQLLDLFESLSSEEAQREFYHELETMRTLCLKLLKTRRSSGAAPSRTTART